MSTRPETVACMTGRRSILMMNLTHLGEGEGGALHQIALMRCFRDFGNTVSMLAPRRPECEKIPGDIRDGVTLTPSMTTLGLPPAFDMLGQLPALVASRLSGNADTLYIRANLFSLFAVAIGRLLGMRVVVEHNGWCAAERRARGGGAFLVAVEKISQVLSARWAHMSRCVTNGIARLLSNNGVSDAKIVVIGNGVDTTAMYPAADAVPCGSGAATTRLGFIGGLVSWQGVDIAIAAMDRLRDVPGLELVIAGDGPERGRLESLAAELDLADRIRFLGYVPRDQALAVINGFDIALAPFTRERNAEIGLSPIKIRDYAAAGRIVVAADIEGVGELSEAGWLFPHASDDADDLADVIRRVIGLSETERKDIGRAARAYAEEHFDWRRISIRIAEFL
jgi:glycosyltransferase involved in cell wall biosynthesis